MARKLVLSLLPVLSAGSKLAPPQRAAWPCDAGESSYAGQFERYHPISG